NDTDSLAMVRARVAKRDHDAIFFLGQQYFSGQLGLQMDSRKGVELYTEAAGLCSIDALFNLAELGCAEIKDRGNYDRAVRHFLISAKMGHKDSLETIKNMFMAGLATKDQYADVLKGYRDAVEEMKSHDRDESASYHLMLRFDNQGALGSVEIFSEELNGHCKIEEAGEALNEITHSLVGSLFCKGTQTVFL
ncbi:hypothetical protein THAOC_12350, partial [Thalassiosira oceanica]